MGKLQDKQQSIEIGYLGIHLACKACQSNESIQKVKESLNLPIFKNVNFIIFLLLAERSKNKQVLEQELSGGIGKYGK